MGSIDSLFLDSISCIRDLDRLIRLFVISKKQKYLNRMTYCRTRKKRIHKFKRGSSKYRFLQEAVIAKR